MEKKDGLGLAALGKSGEFTVEVLSRPDGGWMLSIESPTWCFAFALARPGVRELTDFFQAHAGRPEFAELIIGSFNHAAVRLVKDDEFGDRFFVRAATEGHVVEFTMVGETAQNFALAIADAAAELARVE